MAHRSIHKIFFHLFLVMALVLVGSPFLGLDQHVGAETSCPVTDGGAGDGDATADGTLTINANATWTLSGSAGEYWNCTGKDILITNNATLTLVGDTGNGAYPYIQTDNLQIDSGSSMSADLKGCQGTTAAAGKAPNSSNVCGANVGSGSGWNGQMGAGGGGNGGAGSAGSQGTGGGVYGDPTSPLRTGASGGGTSGYAGGAGGGMIRLAVSGTFTHNGLVTADGATPSGGSSRRPGGGSGGSIYVDSGTIAGSTGTFSANGGGASTSSGKYGGAGGGGRIVVLYNTDSLSLNASDFDVSGGSGANSTYDGDKGTVYTKNKSSNAVNIYSAFDIGDQDLANTSWTIDAAANLWCSTAAVSPSIATTNFTHNGTISCSDANLESLGLSASSSFTLGTGAVINMTTRNADLDFTIPAADNQTWTNVAITTPAEGMFTISDAVAITLAGTSAITGNVQWENLTNLTTNNGTFINASGKGCQYLTGGNGYGPDGINACSSATAGYGRGRPSDNGSTGGGAHGGPGGNASQWPIGGASYDSDSAPALFGSSGGGSNEGGLGHGGGLIKLAVTGTFTHNGAMNVNGGSGGTAANSAWGGGAGGSIYATTGTFTGTTGTISAAGGAGGNKGSFDGGGGGGGRVSVVYSSANNSSYLAGLNAAGVTPGGTGPDSAGNGGTGTFLAASPPDVPDAPTVTAPTASQTEITVNPIVSTGNFTGSSDSHAATDWKIVNNGSSCDGGYIAQNLGSTDLLSSTVNATNWTFTNGSALRYNTAYRLCVRHRSDNQNTASPWSMQTFTTENLASWSNNMTLRVTNSNAGNLLDYQVRVQLDNTIFNFANARSDGADIRFADAGGGLAYPHYIADWDNVNQTAVLWVRVPQINGSNGTTDMKMYSGNNAKTAISTTAGLNTFIDFWDGDNFSDWDNGANNSQFSTFAKVGNNISVKDSANQTQDAQVTVNAAVSALSQVTLESRLKMTNVSGTNDNMVFLLSDDAGYANRVSQLWMPYYTTQGLYGLHENGSNKSISGASFAFDIFKEISIKNNISGGDYDYYIKNTDGTAFTTIANRDKGKGSPDNINYLRLVTAGQNSHKSDVDFDFISFRAYADVEPTVLPTGNVPSAPSLSQPTNNSNQQLTNPNIQGGNFSGDFSLVSLDAKIMTGNSCTSGTPVWEMTDSTRGTNFSVNSYFGSFGGALNGKDALNFETTYYACLRYTNIIGDSNWSSPIAFTTEDLGGFQRTTTSTVSNSSSQLNNHQVRFVLSSSNFDFDAARSDGADIRFSSSDNSNAYPHYVESFDSVGETAVIWVRVDSLPNAGDKTVNIHYSNSPKNIVPPNAGEAVFYEFIDENDVNQFINGHESYSPFDSITSASNAIRLQDTDASSSAGAEILVGGVVPTLDTYTIETRIKAVDTDASNDHIFFAAADTSSANRNFNVMVPRWDDQDAFTWLAGGASSWNKSGDGTFAFNTYYNVVTDMFEGAGDTDITFYDQGRTSLGTGDQNSPSNGTQTKTDRLQFYTRAALNSAKTDTYVDYIAFRQYTANTVSVSIVGGPSVSNLTAVEDANGSGNVAVGFTIDSIGDSAQVQAKLEYSIDGGSSWSDPTLITDASFVAASAGGKPTIDNAGNYQVGKAGGWIDTSGGPVNITVRWDANADTNEDGSDMQIRVTGYDNVSTFAGQVSATTNQTLDVVAPSAPGSADGTVTSSSANLTWNASTETNFNHYEVWYGTDQTDVNNRNNTATEWDDDDDANLATKSTNSTSIAGLSGVTQYYFKICAVDNYGFEACANSFSKTTGAQPTVQSVTAMQKANGSGTIDVSVSVDDVDDDDTLFFTVQDNCAGSYANSVLLTSDASVTATFGDPGVSGNTVGVSGSWITTSSNTANTKNTVQFDLNGNNCTNLEDTYQVQITLNDGGGNISPVTANMIVDQKAPTAPTNLVGSAGTASTLPLTWTPSDDKNFNHYEIWYDAVQANVTNETGTEFDNDPNDPALVNKATSTTTLVGVSGNLYAKVCAVDNYNNKTCTSPTAVTPNVAPVANQIITEHKSNTRTNVCTTVLDADKPGTMHLGADYSTNDGGTYTKMTVVPGTITASGTPSLNQGLSYQIRNIDMSSGSNTVCFDWNTGNDVSNNNSGILLRFRPFDGISEGVSGNGDGGVNSPPVAKFTPTCTDLSCSFSSSASSDPDGNITSRAWSFGDASTSSSANPSKTYSSAGTYIVNLTVSDNNGEIDTVEKAITVTASGSNPVSISNEPPIALFVPSCSGRVCTYNSSNSTDSDGTIASYLWNFGDGTSSTSASPSKTYAADGLYAVSLSITDDDSATDSTNQRISVFNATQAPDTSNDNVPPRAAFSKSCSGLVCSFNAGSSTDSDGSISSYVWTFGDGTTASGATPSKTYTAAGTYSVRLEVIDNDGDYDIKFRNVQVNVSGGATEANQPPIASYTKSCTGLTCTFNASGSSDSDGTISNYYWSFGNGVIVTTQSSSQSKTFPNSGTYKVTLVVEDNVGLKDVTRQDERIFNEDAGAGGGGGVSIMVDNQAPAGFGGVSSTGNTSSSIAIGWDAVSSEENFDRYECYYDTVEEDVTDRSAIRWDESYDINMLDKTQNGTTVNQNISEDTTYYIKCWAKDIYGNEVTFDTITQKSNDRPDIISPSQTFGTDGLGKLDFNVDVDDNDDAPVSLTYHYNIGDGWQAMSLSSSVTSDAGAPDVSGNVIGGSTKVPTASGANTIGATWNTATDLPNYEGTLQIRTYANDSTENGLQSVMENVIVDNLAPRGFANPVGSLAKERDTSKTKADNVRESKTTNAGVPVLNAASTSVDLSWTAVTDEDNWSGIAAYWVTYGLAADTLDQTWDKTDDTDLSTMTTASTTVTGLTSGTTYYFKIHVQDAYGNESTLDTLSVATSAEVVVVTPTSGANTTSGQGGGTSGTTVVVEEEEEKSAGTLGSDDDFDYELPDHWVAPYIEELLSYDYVLDGIEDDERVLDLVMTLLEDPDLEIERDDSVLMLAIVSDLWPEYDFEPEDAEIFSDLDDSNEAFDLIVWSKEEERIDGHPDGTFDPDGYTQRVEALKFIMTFIDVGLEIPTRITQYKALGIFPDVKQATWYSVYLDFALENEIVEGYEDGEFKPANEVTFAELLKMSLLTHELAQ
jgi:hypothetical protein